MASGGARPNSESSSFLFEPLARYSEASSWLGCVRCLRPQSYLCPIPNSTYRQAVLAGCRCFTPSAGCFMPNVPLADRCSVAVDAQHQTVTFSYRDYRHGSQLKDLTLSASEFIRRFSLHILPSALVRIRHYGILGNNRRKRAIELACAILKRRRRALVLQPQSVVQKPMCCPLCGKAGIRLVAFTDAAGLLHMIGPSPMPCDSS